MHAVEKKSNTGLNDLLDADFWQDLCRNILFCFGFLIDFLGLAPALMLEKERQPFALFQKGLVGSMLFPAKKKDKYIIVSL